MRDNIPEEFEGNFVLTAADMISFSRQQAIQHMGVARELLWHLDETEPALAEMWRAQHQREQLETGRRGLIICLRGEMLDVMREHPKYGFLATLMAEWMAKADEYRAAALEALDGDEKAFKWLEERVRRRQH